MTKNEKKAVTLKIVGLTGGSGSGKSAVASVWGERNNIEVIDADTVCRQLLDPEQEGWCILKDILNDEYFLQDKAINRPRLRKAIFGDDALRAQIDGAIHPLVRKVIAANIKDLAEKGLNGFLVEVPLLFEAGWEEDFDEIVVVFAEREKCIQRLMERDKTTSNEAEAMIRSQLPLEDKIFRADHVIDNSGLWPDTCTQLIHLENLLWTNKK